MMAVQIIMRLITVGLIFTDCESACDPAIFNYDEATGECRNCENKTGFNVLDIDAVRKTKIAECVDLSGIDVIYLLDTSTIKDFNKNGYNSLQGYNFRGAVFNDSKLFFNNISSADFSGADLQSLQYGYAVIHGKLDRYTKLPLRGECDSSGDTLSCHQ